MTIEIFISYSHQDEAEKNELLQHLSVLRRGELFDLWSDERIGIGEAWKTEIEEALVRARVAILLVTKNFLNSDFILEKEVPELLKRHEEGLTIIPIIARNCAWRSVGWLAELQVFNNGLSVWRDGGAYVDQELTEVTYLVDAQTAASSPLPDVSPGDLLRTHNHILFVSHASVGERNSTTWLSWLREERRNATPAMMGELYAAIDAAVIEQQEQGVGQLSCQPRDDGVIVVTDGDVAILLGLAIKVLRTTKAANGAYHRMALHSGEKLKATWNERTQLPREDVYIARRLMELGCEGHLLASQQFANLLRKDLEFASVFHNIGSRTINPPESTEVYNVYKRATSEDAESDFGNDNPPLREIPETVVRKFDAPHRLRPCRNDWVRVKFWPGHSYIEVRFTFKNSNGEKATGVSIDCHKHWEQGCTFEYRSTESPPEHLPKFKIAAEDPSKDMSLFMEMSCYNNYDEQLGLPVKRRIRLLHKPPLPSKISEVFQVIPWAWYHLMCWPWPLRVVTFSLLLFISITVGYLWLRTYIPPELRSEWGCKLEDLKRKHWYGHETYLEPPWHDEIDMDRSPAEHWQFENKQLELTKGEGTDDNDGALLISGGPNMVTASNLGSKAFYDFEVKFKLRFIKGDKAVWVFRANPESQSGYVFTLEKSSSSHLVLQGRRYRGPNSSVSFDNFGPREVPIGATCCQVNDAFEITATVQGYNISFKITVVSRDRRPARDGPHTISPAFIDEDQSYRYGNNGFLMPPDTQMRLEYWRMEVIRSECDPKVP
jgi:TIR domain